jgi:hypothetical protein
MTIASNGSDTNTCFAILNSVFMQQTVRQPQLAFVVYFLTYLLNVNVLAQFSHNFEVK